MSIEDIRYTRLGYLALTVTDPVRSEAFYREIVGVETTISDDGNSVFLRVSDRHHDLVLTRGETAALNRIGWEMESTKALAAAQEHLHSLGIVVHSVNNQEARALGITDAIRFTEPTTGTTFELYAGMDAAAPYEPTHTQIARLGHVVLASPAKTTTEKFLTDEMNFRVSDRIGDVVTFMRCFPNPYHHSFGVGGGDVASFAHLNFMVTNFDDIGRANVRMKKNGVKVVYGPGRHPTSDSVFFYFLDPDGLTLEYSFGMEEFPEHDARDGRVLPVVPESFDLWGGSPDSDFCRPVPIERLPAGESQTSPPVGPTASYAPIGAH